MKRGKTDRETVELNGWKVGDILEGDEGYGPQRVKITAIGDDAILCRWDNYCDGNWSRDRLTTLSCREWRRISGPGKRTSDKGIKVDFNMAKCRGMQMRLKNRRVRLYTDGGAYALAFKSLTEEGKVFRTQLGLTAEAMFALVELFNDLRGPLPEGLRWAPDGSLQKAFTDAEIELLTGFKPVSVVPESGKTCGLCGAENAKQRYRRELFYTDEFICRSCAERIAAENMVDGVAVDFEALAADEKEKVDSTSATT